MMKKRGDLIAIVLMIAIAVISSLGAYAQASDGIATTGFPPLDLWRKAVIQGDATELKAFYSSDSPVRVRIAEINTGIDDDVSFWLRMRGTDLKLEMVGIKERPYGKLVVFKTVAQDAGGQNVDITNSQAWKKEGKDGDWRIVSVERTVSPHLQQPSDMNKNIYPDDADARAEIKEAEEKAAAHHQRVLLIFGANWCYDCHVLDLALHRSDFEPAAAGYEIVHVDIGPDGKKNSDVAKEFDVPLDKGIPAVAVIENDGKIVVSQKNGEFEDARALTPGVLLEFLNKWKPAVQ